MGLNSQSDIEADLQIGPTSTGMVRIYITGPFVDLPMDFSPEAAREIAEELVAAAEISQGAGEPGKSDVKAPPNKRR